MPERFAATPGRLDVVVTALTGVPRADVQRAIADGLVTVDGVTRPKSFRLVGDEELEVDLLTDRSLVPDPRSVPVRYRDDQLVVVAKPAGVITHPTATHRTGTLVNRLLGMGVPLASAGGGDRPGIVHRLDVGTSGLMLVASSDAAFRPHAPDPGPPAGDRPPNRGRSQLRRWRRRGAPDRSPPAVPALLAARVRPPHHR